MKIQTEQDMKHFCSLIKFPFAIKLTDSLSPEQVREWEAISGKWDPGQNLEQGINDLVYHPHEEFIVLDEVPRLYPKPPIIEKCPENLGPMIGVLVNCYDPNKKTFLYHIRGRSTDKPFMIQAAAAGGGKFRRHPYETALVELAEEAGITNPISLLGRKAISIHQFMKGKIPQPLFSFGFLYDSTSFPAKTFRLCHSIDEIEEYETQIKQEITAGNRYPIEAYHFHLPASLAEKVLTELNSKNKLFGPIASSQLQFERALKDFSELD